MSFCVKAIDAASAAVKMPMTVIVSIAPGACTKIGFARATM
jgi:hypothetical protein